MGGEEGYERGTAARRRAPDTQPQPDPTRPGPLPRCAERATRGTRAPERPSERAGDARRRSRCGQQTAASACARACTGQGRWGRLSARRGQRPPCR